MTDSAVDWLTPAPDGTPVTLPWPDEDGPLLLTCHLARVDGRTLLVGLDVRSFTLDADGHPAPGPAGLAEINHPALRSLRAGEIAEAARARLAAVLAAQPAAASQLRALTSPDRPRPVGTRPAGEQLQRVAELYAQALTAGGDQARRPSIHVHEALTAAGVDVTLAAVRGQIHRARVEGTDSARRPPVGVP